MIEWVVEEYPIAYVMLTVLFLAIFMTIARQVFASANRKAQK